MHRDPHITPEIAAHVLFHIGRGGWPGNTFVQKLLATFDAADAPNRLRLAEGFPGYAAAFELAKSTNDGVAILQARADDDH
ncbi:hypothetical protein HNP84_010281 [Thermocatellispora tengchongensis]|uniref:Uncharacterized protein n=1 Tax=Thermocatellispora tengchongensis TaxID=1073253 RepID=A0A840PQY1_9ACTN|nr:hypothetical protein [Thermocatellispora tengchongensis]MBB5140513.1 hypothetical protein [Thermocatellispora tengchongensis]